MTIPQPASYARLVLPRPMSTNALFRNVEGRGRVETSEYRSWQKDCRDWLRAQMPLPRFLQPVQVTLFLGEVGVGNMDADNGAKAPIDLLVSLGVIKNDSRRWVRLAQQVWVPDLRGLVIDVRTAAPQTTAQALISSLSRVQQELMS